MNNVTNKYIIWENTSTTYNTHKDTKDIFQANYRNYSAGVKAENQAKLFSFPFAPYLMSVPKFLSKYQASIQFFQNKSLNQHIVLGWLNHVIHKKGSCGKREVCDSVN